MGRTVLVGEKGVGMVSLLQDHYCIPHVAVYKVDPEVGSTCRTSLNHLNRHTTERTVLIKDTL